MTHSSASNDDGDDKLDIDLDLLGILKRRFHLIALGIFVGATLATIFYVQQVPIYESQLSILVGQRSSELTKTGVGNANEGVNTIQEEILSTHMELFGSSKILSEAAVRNGIGQSAGDIYGQLSISKGGEGLAKSASVLKASFRDPDPQVAADTLNAIYESYRNYIDNQSRNVGTDAAELIASAQLKNEESLRRADEEYRDFIASVPALVNSSVDGNGRLEDVHQMRLQKIEAELAQVRTGLATLKSRKAMIQEFVRGRDEGDISDTEVMAILTDEEINRLQAFVNLYTDDMEEMEERQMSRAITQESTRLEYNKMLELSSELSLMRSTFGDEHPSVRTIEDRLDNLKSYLSKARSKNATPEEDKEIKVPAVEMLSHHFNVLQSDIAGFSQREKELIRLSEQEGKMAKEVQMTFMRGSSLKANLDRARNRYDQVFQRLQEINLTNDYAGFSTDLLISPAPALEPVWPAKTKIAALGILAGGLLGLGLAMLAEVADRTFRDPSEVEQVIGSTILTHIPRMVEHKLAKRTKPNSLVSPMIPAFHLPRGSESETFRVLRTSVLLQSKSAGKKVIMMTSPSPSDGKSTTIANLAVSIAQTGKKVLLVDGDMRRPTVAKNFGLDPSTGLVDFLTGEERFEDCLHPSEQTDLTICPRGARTSAPAELLESPQFVDFVRHAREEFDIVLIDAPPLLAVTDPAIIAEHADSCLITIRIEKNNRTLVQRAAEILSEQGKPIDGIIVNSRDSRANAYGYSSYNYYGKKEHGYLAKYRDYYASDDADDDSPKKKRTRRSSSRKSGSAETRSAETRSPESGGAFNTAKTPAANGHVRNGVLPGSKQESEAGSVASGRVEAGRVSES